MWGGGSGWSRPTVGASCSLLLPVDAVVWNPRGASDVVSGTAPDGHGGSAIPDHPDLARGAGPGCARWPDTTAPSAGRRGRSSTTCRLSTTAPSCAGSRSTTRCAGAEVYVGSLNFELLQPLEGPNLWSRVHGPPRRGHRLHRHHVPRARGRRRGQGRPSRRRFDIDVIMKADIGDHIEYYYLDTEEQFGCLIESGSGHAIDFVKTGPGLSRTRAPSRVRRRPAASPTPSPRSRSSVRDLEAKMQRLPRGVRLGALEDLRGGRQDRHAPLRVEREAGRLQGALGRDDGRRHQLRAHRAAWRLGNPWQEFVDEKGEGITSIAVMFETREESERVKAQFAGGRHRRHGRRPYRRRHRVVLPGHRAALQVHHRVGQRSRARLPAGYGGLSMTSGASTSA